MLVLPFRGCAGRWTPSAEVPGIGSKSPAWPLDRHLKIPALIAREQLPAESPY